MFVSSNSQTGTIGGGWLEWEASQEAQRIIGGKAGPVTRTFTLGPENGQCCGGKVVLDFRLTEPDEAEIKPVLIFGGGHVGAALAASLKPHHNAVAVFDTREGYGTQTAIPEAEIRAAPPSSAFVITTHDHGLDFLLVEEALSRGDAAYVGMIGSATKRATLERRLREKGVDAEPLVCPIGASGRGDKRPEIIALHTAAEILQALAP